MSQSENISKQEEKIPAQMTGNKKIRIGFADLTHTGRGVSSIMLPYGVSLVASYALKKFKDQIEADIFKYPEDFKSYLEKTPPKIVCFSSYHWTTNLSYEFAKRIKKKHPGTIIVFGGPNFPLDTSDKKKYLEKYPLMDFCLEGEGELAFAELLKKLMEHNFDVKAIKEKEIKIPNCYYLSKDILFFGAFLPRLSDLDEIPSPYLSGLLDKFFDGVLSPGIQTTRGCPFTCTYCQESILYFNKIARFSYKRIRDELDYIAKRNVVPELILVDSNFGMYEEDLEFSRQIAEVLDKYDWPKFITVSTGKNQKKRVIEAAKILKGRLVLFASVQSTDPVVLKNICRQNVGVSDSIEIAKTSEEYGANSFSEIILCLPGDTKQAHFKSMLDMVDAGLNVVRSHQLIMLPGTVLASRESREKYNMVTNFRVYPRCFGRYELYGEKFSAFEVEEICVANNTMPYEDYLESRKLDLTIEILYNSGIFYELFQFLKQKSIKTSYLIKKLHEQSISKGSDLFDIYDGFLKVGKENSWKSAEEFENFLSQQDTVDKYAEGVFGSNEQLNYRAITFFERMDQLHKITYEAAKQLLLESEKLSDDDTSYLDELYEFSLLRKGSILSFDKNISKIFHHDFLKLISCKFNATPSSFKVDTGISIKIAHTQKQKELISGYIKQYGSSIDGLGLILSRSHINKLYREVSAGK